MDGRSLIVLVVFICLLAQASTAETYTADINDANSWWGNLFLSFTPATTTPQNILMIQGEDKLEFTYNANVLGEVDEVSTGYAVYIKDNLDSNFCSDARDQGYIVQSFDSREWGPGVGSLIVTMDDIWNSQRWGGAVTSGGDGACFVSAPQTQTNQDSKGTISIPTSLLTPAGNSPRDYWVVAAYCAKDAGWITDDYNCEGYSLNVRVVPDDYCGEDAIYETITKHNWDEICYKDGGKYCDRNKYSDGTGECTDPCQNCPSDQCLGNQVLGANDLKELVQVSENLCVPLKDMCEDTNDCKGLTLINPSSPYKGKIEDFAVGQAYTCDKVNPNNPLIKAFNELPSSKARDGGYGQCKPGAVTAADCAQQFNPPYLYKYEDQVGGFTTGKTYGVDANGKCVIGVCTSPGVGCEYKVGRTTSGQAITSTGHCKGYDLRTRTWGCVPGVGAENCVGKCDYPMPPADGWVCDSDTDCDCPDGRRGTCTQTAEGWGICSSCNNQPDPKITNFCTDNGVSEQCAYSLFNLLSSCEMPVCGPTGMCTTEKQDFKCTEDTDCEIGGFSLRSCDKSSGCCVNNFASDANCFDGKKNCHHDKCEVNVDCGGPCEKVCGVVVINEPSFMEQYGWVVYLMIASIIILVLIGIFIMLYERGILKW